MKCVAWTEQVFPLIDFPNREKLADYVKNLRIMQKWLRYVRQNINII